MPISFGDNVRILQSEETDKLDLAGKTGEVLGETRPSMTGVEVIGKTEEDYAINVSIDEMGSEFWFATHLLELLDDNEGKEETVINDSITIETKKWWQFWK